jgi:hypothetical protein
LIDPEIPSVRTRGKTGFFFEASSEWTASKKLFDSPGLTYFLSLFFYPFNGLISRSLYL